MRKNKKNGNGKKNILLKVELKQDSVFKQMAKRYMDGNKSAWLRFAAANFHPSKAQLRKAGNGSGRAA